MNENTYRMLDRLASLGISREDRLALRRIQMTLHRWAELERGDANGNCIERDDETGKPFMTYERGMNGERGRHKVADREKGALKRLAAIMANYPDLAAYHQTDPRGCALYIVPNTVITGKNIDSVYSYGVAVIA